jgi:hypothetical protein
MKNRDILTVYQQKYLIIRMENSEYRRTPDSIAGVGNKVALPDSQRQSSLLIHNSSKKSIISN